MDRSIFNLQMVQFWKLGQYSHGHFTRDHFSSLLVTFTSEEKISLKLLKKIDTILSSRSNVLKNESKLNEFLNSPFQLNST